jgi:hypothetical protein
MMALLSNALSAICASKGNPLMNGRPRVEVLSRREREAYEIAERVGERQDLGGHAPFERERTKTLFQCKARQFDGTASSAILIATRHPRAESGR